MPTTSEDERSLRSERTRVRRKPERAAYDREAVNEIIDAALYCHVGSVRDDQPVVLPTIHARCGDTLYLHGSTGAGQMRDMRRGIPVCVTFTLVDDIVLTRAARTHSLNYRSAVVLGSAVLIRDAEVKLAALEAITDHVVPGRWSTVQHPSPAELREVEVMAVAIVEASAKQRTGPPTVDETNGEISAWAGTIPILTARGEPERAVFVPATTAPPQW